jgi:hypothetical protein
MQWKAEHSRDMLFTLKLEAHNNSQIQTLENIVPDFSPPANKDKFPTDVAAREWRATLSRAVDHVPVELL